MYSQDCEFDTFEKSRRLLERSHVYCILQGTLGSQISLSLPLIEYGVHPTQMTGQLLALLGRSPE